jgi:hypothetical protein
VVNSEPEAVVVSMGMDAENEEEIEMEPMAEVEEELLPSDESDEELPVRQPIRMLLNLRNNSPQLL